MKKRLFALLLATVFIVAMLAGCNGGGGTVTDNANNTASPTTDTPSGTEPSTPTEGVDDPYYIELPLTEEPAELTLWATINPQVAQITGDGGLGKTAIFEYFESVSNVELVSTSVAGNMAMDLFPVMINSGDYTDLLGSMSQLYTGGLDGAIGDEIIIDMTDLINEYMPNYSKWLYSNDNYVKALTTDAGNMGVFGMMSDGNPLQDLGPMIRKDWLDELGMGVPTTYDELYEALVGFKTLGASDPMWINNIGTTSRNYLTDGYGVAGSYSPMERFEPYTVVGGVVQFSYTADGFRDYLAMISKWYAEGLIWSDFASEGDISNISTSNCYSLVLNGNMGFFTNGELSDLSKIPNEAEDPNFGLVAMADVTINKGDTLHVKNGNAEPQGTWSISTSCPENKYELICKYVDWWYTEEGSDLASWGIEGEAWEYDASGDRAFTDLILNNPDDLSLKVTMTLYVGDDSPALIQVARSRALYDDAALAASDLWVSNIDGAYYYPSSASMTSEENASYTNLFNDIVTYARESIPKFMTGALSVENDWDNYVATIEGMGIAECVGNKQAAYDRYAAK